jgi:hypothetical protein
MNRDSEKNSKYYSNWKRKRSENFGKFGIVNLSDLFTRKLEFQAWFSEIKKKSVNDLNSENDRRYFEEFIDKYNNAELPSKKYYDIIKYQSKKLNNLLRKRKKEKDKLLASSNFNLLPVDECEFVFDDEGQKEKEKKFLKELEQKRKLADAINTMNKEKAEAMKEIEFKGNLMRHLYQTGDTTAALDIHKQYFEVKKDKDKPEPIPQIDDYDQDNH